MNRYIALLSLMLLLTACTTSMPNQESTPTPVPSASVEVLSNGQEKYTDAARKFSYIYPSEWIERNGNLYTDEEESPPIVMVSEQLKSEYVKDGRGVALDAKAGTKKDIGNGLTETKQEEFTVGKYKAARYITARADTGRTTATESMIVRIDRGEKILELRLFTLSDAAKNKENTEKFNLVVSSITFSK